MLVSLFMLAQLEAAAKGSEAKEEEVEEEEKRDIIEKYVQENQENAEMNS